METGVIEATSVETKEPGRIKTVLTDEEMIRNYLPYQPNICFEAIYNRYVEKIYRQCYSITKDVAQAQDFTHDIFLKVFSKLESFQQRSSFATWLHSIANNYCMDQFRIAKRYYVIPLDEDYIANIADMAETQLQRERLQQFEKAMSTLAVTDQAILRLKYEQGLSIKDIAQLFVISVSAVKMRLKRSREKLQLNYDKRYSQDM